MSYLDNSIKGIWSGWGYFSFLPQLSEDSFKPKYIKLVEDYINILNSELEKPQLEIEMLSLKWVCGYKVICTPTNYTKYSYNQDTIEEVTQKMNEFIEEKKVIINIFPLTLLS